MSNCIDLIQFGQNSWLKFTGGVLYVGNQTEAFVRTITNGVFVDDGGTKLPNCTRLCNLTKEAGWIFHMRGGSTSNCIKSVQFVW